MDQWASDREYIFWSEDYFVVVVEHFKAPEIGMHLLIDDFLPPLQARRPRDVVFIYLYTDTLDLKFLFSLN